MRCLKRAHRFSFVACMVEYKALKIIFQRLLFQRRKVLFFQSNCKKKPSFHNSCTKLTKLSYSGVAFLVTSNYFYNDSERNECWWHFFLVWYTFQTFLCRIHDETRLKALSLTSWRSLWKNEKNLPTLYLKKF